VQFTLQVIDSHQIQIPKKLIPSRGPETDPKWMLWHSNSACFGAQDCNSYLNAKEVTFFRFRAECRKIAKTRFQAVGEKYVPNKRFAPTKVLEPLFLHVVILVSVVAKASYSIVVILKNKWFYSFLLVLLVIVLVTYSITKLSEQCFLGLHMIGFCLFFTTKALRRTGAFAQAGFN
jgi:hypothetical protein